MLKKDEVHVWHVLLAIETLKVPDLMRKLPEDERARASRFHFQIDHDRFVVTRGLLRAILARYLGTEPSQIKFSYNPFGKPALAMGLEANALQFNLSHSHDLAVIAVTYGSRIGVDLERLQPDFASDQLAQQFLSKREIASLKALPPERQEVEFFRYWTCKEAYVKARGEGLSLSLSLPLAQFEVQSTPVNSDFRLVAAEGQQELSQWCLRSLDVEDGYVATVAVEGCNWQLKYRHWR